ncbi:MAG: Protein translocase subunit SecD [candidate division TM6 bacterium GW2011_GWF2_37_49]|nr:MAG: Protein translocase subunit SecD [candidate division TM6 bacterium GW2011_GWF2_37_49]
MVTKNRLVNVLLTPFMAWVAVIVIGSYFMFSFDPKILREPAEKPGIVGTLSKYYNALKLTYIKKGIDLAGGLYSVWSVDLEKAIEDRLGIENKSFDQIFKNKNLKILPKAKEIKNGSIILSFETEEAAKTCFNLLQEIKSGSLKLKVSGDQVFAELAPELDRTIRSGAVEQAVSVLTSRLGGYGVEGVSVISQGDRKVVVQLPGVEDPERVRALISKAAHLEFKIVEKIGATRDSLLDAYDGELPSNLVIVSGKPIVDEATGLEEASHYFLVSAFPDMTGDKIIDSYVSRDEFNKPNVVFKMDSTGGKEFAELTANNVDRSIGIIMDDVMISYPKINHAITGGSASIIGIASQKEAVDLSIVLKSGSLVAPLRLEQENRVGASLGQDSIYKGFMSCIIAMLLIFLFSFLYYRIPGLLAVITLLVNLFFVLLFLSYFNASLSLSGIAGIVLSLGMAIDASILIYERAKEELAAGASLRAAILGGFDSAFAVIMDSNITTFLTGLVLFQFGGPAVRNFATTLMLGIVATVLTGVYFLKALFLFIFDILNVKSMKL